MSCGKFCSASVLRTQRTSWRGRSPLERIYAHLERLRRQFDDLNTSAKRLEEGLACRGTVDRTLLHRIVGRLATLKVAITRLEKQL